MIKVVATGSRGNFYILEAGEEILLLECGIHIKEIKKALNFDLSKVVGCLLTHSHNDHCKAIKEVLKFTDVFTSKGTKEELQERFELNRHCFEVEHNKPFEIGGFMIVPFNTQHDTKEPLGFLIHHKEIGNVIFATDTYYLKYKFRNIDYALVECNYSEEILEELPAYRARLLKSHMSLENLKETLKTWDLSKSKKIVLIHMSDTHGNSEKFIKEINELTGIETIIAAPGVEL